MRNKVRAVVAVLILIEAVSSSRQRPTCIVSEPLLGKSCEAFKHEW